jgi:hypothetical protein
VPLLVGGEAEGEHLPEYVADGVAAGGGQLFEVVPGGAAYTHMDRDPWIVGGKRHLTSVYTVSTLVKGSRPAVGRA